jgi:hypothetical protein
MEWQYFAALGYSPTGRLMNRSAQFLEAMSAYDADNESSALRLMLRKAADKGFKQAENALWSVIH